MTMPCPRCQAHTLQAVQLKDPPVEIDRCSDCGGLWFDARELEMIMDVAVKELAIPSGAEKSGLACPRDGEVLYAYNYPQTDVTVDMCPGCTGLWLDAGELQEIKRVRSNRATLGAKDDPGGPLSRFLEWLQDLVDFGFV